jgi:hypothetical protein
MQLSKNNIIEFFKVTIPSVFSYLTFRYVDGKQAIEGFLNEIYMQATPIFVSILVGFCTYLFLQYKKLTYQQENNFKIAKNAYLWAWVANHFDLKGHWRTPDSTNPIVYKCFDTHHNYKEVILSNEDFEKAMAFISTRFDANGGHLTVEDRMVFETKILQNIRK